MSETSVGGASRTPIRVFINYRRDDASGHAGRLYDALLPRLGKESVFMDVDERIEPGVDFTRVLDEKVRSCDVLIALIGRRWLTETDRQGRRRIDKPDDFVRVEIESALRRGDDDVRVIPAIVEGAEMPSAEDLPDELKPLAFRQALKLRHEEWSRDLAELVRALENVAAQKAAREAAERDRREAEDRDVRERDEADRRRAEEEQRARREAERRAKEERKPPDWVGGSATPPVRHVRFGRRGLAAGAGAVALGAVGIVLALVLAARDEAGTSPTQPTTTADTAVETTAGTTTLPPPSLPTLVERNELVFRRDDGIYAMNLDGSGVRRLLERAGVFGVPAVSPDRTKILFEPSEDGGISMLEADGSVTTIAEPATGDFDPSWSPDGSRIAFTRGADDDGVYVMAVEGTGATKLTSAENGYSPAWSPDGSRISFTSEPPSRCERRFCRAEIYVVNADGTGLTRITHNAVADGLPAWSPDGTRIAFHSRRNDPSCEETYCNEEIYVIDADGSGARRVTRGPAADLAPSWSADGSQIVFVRRTADALVGIYVIDASGANERRLTSAESYAPTVAW